MERERDIERKLKKRVERMGGLCFKFLSSVSGVPDRLCLFYPGRVIFVETKKPGEKPRPLQMRQIRRIRELGFRDEEIDSEQGIEELVNSLEEGKTKKAKEEKEQKTKPEKEEKEEKTKPEKGGNQNAI